MSVAGAADLKGDRKVNVPLFGLLSESTIIASDMGIRLAGLLDGGREKPGACWTVRLGVPSIDPIGKASIRGPASGLSIGTRRAGVRSGSFKAGVRTSLKGDWGEMRFRVADWPRAADRKGGAYPAGGR